MFRVAEVIKKYNLSTKKKFGQNFLVDENLLDKIVDVAGNIKEKNILEIGPGPGGLTYSILKKEPKKLVSIEIDNDLYKILSDEFINYKNFNVFNIDALKINEKDFFENNINVIANLPYNIGTALLIKWLNNLNIFDSFTLLLQKEVVDRITAKTYTKDYGRLSVLVQALCYVQKSFDIKPSCFIPPPKVMSSIIHIIPKEKIDQINIEKLSFITFALFNQRRKKIKKVIENLITLQKLDESILDLIDLNKRAEELEISEFLKLSNLLAPL